MTVLGADGHPSRSNKATARPKPNTEGTEARSTQRKQPQSKRQLGVVSSHAGIACNAIGSRRTSILSRASNRPTSGAAARSFLVATVFLAAALRLLVRAAFLPAALNFRVFAALLAIALMGNLRLKPPEKGPKGRQCNSLK